MKTQHLATIEVAQDEKLAERKALEKIIKAEQDITVKITLGE